MLDPATNEIIYSSNGGDEIHESEDTGNEDVNEDNNFESHMRRRKGKIISCAKETIEQGNFICSSYQKQIGQSKTFGALILDKKNSI